MYDDVLERLAQCADEAAIEGDDALLRLADPGVAGDERLRLRVAHLRRNQTAVAVRAVVRRAVEAGHGSDILI